MVEGQGVQIVHTGGVGHELGKVAVFGNLFVHAVNVAKNRLCPGDILAVHGHLDAQYAMGGRVLRPQVEHKGFFVVRPGKIHGA